MRTSILWFWNVPFLADTNTYIARMNGPPPKVLDTPRPGRIAAPVEPNCPNPSVRESTLNYEDINEEEMFDSSKYQTLASFVHPN